jgi:hypothetical protein
MATPPKPVQQVALNYLNAQDLNFNHCEAFAQDVSRAYPQAPLAGYQDLAELQHSYCTYDPMLCGDHLAEKIALMTYAMVRQRNLFVQQNGPNAQLDQQLDQALRACPGNRVFVAWDNSQPRNWTVSFGQPQGVGQLSTPVVVSQQPQPQQHMQQQPPPQQPMMQQPMMQPQQHMQQQPPPQQPMMQQPMMQPQQQMQQQPPQQQPMMQPQQQMQQQPPQQQPMMHPQQVRPNPQNVVHSQLSSVDALLKYFETEDKLRASNNPGEVQNLIQQMEGLCLSIDQNDRGTYQASCREAAKAARKRVGANSQPGPNAQTVRPQQPSQQPVASSYGNWNNPPQAQSQSPMMQPMMQQQQPMMQPMMPPQQMMQPPPQPGGQYAQWNLQGQPMMQPMMPPQQMMQPPPQPGGAYAQWNFQGQQQQAQPHGGMYAPQPAMAPIAAAPVNQQPQTDLQLWTKAVGFHCNKQPSVTPFGRNGSTWEQAKATPLANRKTTAWEFPVTSQQKNATLVLTPGALELLRGHQGFKNAIAYSSFPSTLEGMGILWDMQGDGTFSMFNPLLFQQAMQNPYIRIRLSQALECLAGLGYNDDPNPQNTIVGQFLAFLIPQAYHYNVDQKSIGIWQKKGKQYWVPGQGWASHQ